MEQNSLQSYYVVLEGFTARTVLTCVILNTLRAALAEKYIAEP